LHPSRPSLPLADTPPPQLYTLSLHDALPICSRRQAIHQQPVDVSTDFFIQRIKSIGVLDLVARTVECRGTGAWNNHVTPQGPSRSEEHTSELQSRENLVCRLLLEKKKQPQHT